MMRSGAVARGVTAAARDGNRLRNVDAAAGGHMNATKVVPAAQIAEGNAEAVSDGDERVSAAHGVKQAARSGTRDGNDESLHAVE